MAGETRFTPTEEDYLAAQREWLSRTTLRWRVVGRLALGAVASGLATFALLLLTGNDLAPAFGFLAAVVFVVAMFACGLVNYLLLPRRSRRLFRQHKSLHGEHGYAWSDQGLRYQSESGMGTIAWADLYRWSNGREIFLLLVNQNMFHFLPRRVFSDAEAADLVETATRIGPPRF